MNCKPGDMAIVVSSRCYPQYVGLIITVTDLSVINPGYWYSEKKYYTADGREIVWRDKTLRPIRPSDEQDEMLRIVGLPNKEKEKA